MKKLIFRLVSFSLVLFSLFVIPKYAWATFKLTLEPHPYRGSDDLRFDRVDPTGEPRSEILKVEISTDIGKQYEVTQNLLTPLTNPASGVSIPDENFIFYARRKMAQGVLNYIEQDTGVRGTRNMYTSNSQGTADSFDLVYVIRTPLDVPAGVYQCRLGFSLRAINDPTQPEKTEPLNVIVQVGAGKPTIEITTATGTKIISLNSVKENMQSFDVLVNIKAGLGAQFEISQVIPRALESAEGEQIPYRAINFQIREAKKGIGVVRPLALSVGPDILYTSGLKGEPDSFIITYSLQDIEKLKAGRYRTTIQYRLEGAGAFIQEGIIETFGLEVEIEPVFDIIVKTESESGKIEFKDLKPSGQTKTFEVSIEVKTNKAKPYQVIQKMHSELVSKEGNMIPPDDFTLKTESIDTEGILKFPQKGPAKKGETVLFVSDKKGSPDTFKVIYELKAARDIKLGDYATSVSYSISEI